MVKTDKKEGLVIKYKTYNNKSRKGEYAYLREGKKIRIYKVNQEIKTKLDSLRKTNQGTRKIDNIYRTAFRTDLVRKGRQGVTEKKVNIIRTSMKGFNKKYANIEEALETGYAESDVELSGLNHYIIKNAYRDLLINKNNKGDGRRIVKDDLLVNILTLPDNIEKWKHRVLYQIKVFNDQNELLTELTPNNIKTLYDIKKEMGMVIKKGEEWTEQYREVMDKAKAFGYRARSLEVHKGYVSRISITLTYRKA